MEWSPVGMEFRQAIGAGPLVLDGGLATTLEANGHDLSSDLWSARVLVEEPAAIGAVHEAFLDAGAQVLISASYQASLDGFTRTDLTIDQAKAAIRRSVELAHRAIARWSDRTGSDAPRWVAGSVGPLGAALADGSEYTGRYDRTAAELRDFHAPRVEALVAAGADVLAIETQPRLDEAYIALDLATSAGIDAWVSFTTRDGTALPDGTPLDEAAATVTGLGAIATGVNCCPAAAARRALDTLGPVATTVAYPNIGARWDAERRAWVEPDHAPPLLDLLAADLVGGCCGTSPHDIAALVAKIGDPPTA